MGRTTSNRIWGWPSRNGAGSTECVWEQLRDDIMLKISHPEPQDLMRNWVIPALQEVHLHQGPAALDTIDKFAAHAMAVPPTQFTAATSLAGSDPARRRDANLILLFLGRMSPAELREFFAYARHWRDERIF